MFTEQQLIQEVNYANAVKQQTINQLVEENNILKYTVQEYKKLIDRIQVEYVNSLLQAQLYHQQPKPQLQPQAQFDQQNQYLSNLLNEINKAISK